MLPDTILPAHRTKHVPILDHPFRNSAFHLAQLHDGAANGTALWLGAQCLSLYLAHVLKNNTSSSPTRPRVVELGSGIGLSACVPPIEPPLRVHQRRLARSSLALASMGWDVLATDLPQVISAVLASNITRNASQLPADSGAIQVRALDWTVPPDRWTWHHEYYVASPEFTRVLGTDQPSQTLCPPFDIIISSDTLYMPEIVQPLFRTIHALSVASVAASASSRPPPVYLCLERRDPALINSALAGAKETWDFSVERVPQKKVAKAMEKGGAKWAREDWDGVEIWKLTLNTSKKPNRDWLSSSEFEGDTHET